MTLLCVALVFIALAISLPGAWLACRVGGRLGALDTSGVPGQVKTDARRVPNIGGVAIFWAISLPMIVGLVAVNLLAGRDDLSLVPAALTEHLPGIVERTPVALGLLGSLALLHVLGLIDDRRPMGPWVKLAVMAIPAVAIPVLDDGTRLLTLLGSPVLSIALTALWLLVITNAMNFMDNMDGLLAGVAGVAGAAFMTAALIQGQWFVAAMLGLLIGACLGFLVFNFPPARLFMGDGGSLVIGFLLAFLTVRTTYYEAGTEAGAWYGLFMPLCVLAVPIYDFVSVVTIRLAQGRNPFVGDLQHFSHRLARRGLSPRGTIVVVYGATAVTGISGIALGSLKPWQASLVGTQTLLILIVLAVFEYSTTRDHHA